MALTGNFHHARPAARIFVQGTVTNPNPFSSSEHKFGLIIKNSPEKIYPKPGLTGISTSSFVGGVVFNPNLSIEPDFFISNFYITNLSATDILEFSFDGINIHGIVRPSTEKPFTNRLESAISFRARTGSVNFVFEGW